jgi:hypothetical protein
MKNNSVILFVLLLLVSAAQANEKGNGGNATALEFMKNLSNALGGILKSNSELATRLNEGEILNRAKHATIVVVETPLIINIQGIDQPCVATNDPQRSLIQINQNQWAAINDVHIKEAIALHEVLSLEGLEDTGNYPLSSQYISQFGIKSSLIVGSFEEEAPASRGIKLSILGGVNFSTFTSGDESPFSINPSEGSGPTFATLISFDLSKKVEIETGLVFSREKVNFSQGGASFYSSSFTTLQLPVVLRYKLLPYLSAGAGIYYATIAGNVLNTASSGGNLASGGINSSDYGVLFNTRIL